MQPNVFQSVCCHSPTLHLCGRQQHEEPEKRQPEDRLRLQGWCCVCGLCSPALEGCCHANPGLGETRGGIKHFFFHVASMEDSTLLSSRRVFDPTLFESDGTHHFVHTCGRFLVCFG